MDKQKAALIEAIARKGSALCELYIKQHDAVLSAELPRSTTSSSDTDVPAVTLPTPTVEDIDVLMKDILKLTDNTDSKVFFQNLFIKYIHTKHVNIHANNLHIYTGIVILYCRPISKMTFLF
jgi:hypothetical protein